MNPDQDFTITRTWLLQHGGRGAAWTRDQFEAIGIPWPPKSGWKLRVIGTRISQAQRERFERRLDRRQVRNSGPGLFDDQGT